MRTRFSIVLLVLGLLLLWPVPLGGALLLVTASVGLAITFESEMAPPHMAPARNEEQLLRH